MKKIVAVEGMSCPHCASSLKNAFAYHKVKAEVDFAKKQVIVEEVADELIIEIIEEEGYEVKHIKKMD